MRICFENVSAEFESFEPASPSGAGAPAARRSQGGRPAGLRRWFSTSRSGPEADTPPQSEQDPAGAGTKIVLRDINLVLDERRIGVIGANGGGKSTLIRLINGLGQASRGRVTVDGMDVAQHGTDVRKRMGFVFSDADNQIVMPTVEQDVTFSIRKMPRHERDRRVTEMLQRFGLPREQSPYTLSGGQKQLLALAGALVREPELIIADEPTTLLDLRNRDLIRRVFADLEQQLIVVTHDLDFIADFDRAILIDEHRVAADGEPREVIERYRALMRR